MMLFVLYRVTVEKELSEIIQTLFLWRVLVFVARLR